MPGLEDGTIMGQDSIYVAAKYYFSLLQSAAVLSIPAVQSGMLLALYEHGHGSPQASYLSVGACAHMSHTLGLHELKDIGPLDNPEEWADATERSHVWWGVVILDRYIHHITTIGASKMR
jgi:hypothetical protein